MGISSRSQIVGSGANLLAPVAVGTIPRVVDIGPPGALSDSLIRQRGDGAVDYIVVGPTNVREGVGATETFRLSQGFISEGAGADSFRAGRGANASGVDSVVIGRSANSNSSARSIILGVQAAAADTADDQIIIGESASGRGTGTIVIGSDAGVGNGAGGFAQIVIGDGANVVANGGNPTLMAIGTTASAGANTQSGGSYFAMGASAVARGKGDVVIGHSASQNQAAALVSDTTLVGTGAVANVAQGRNVIVGANSSTTGTACVILGQGNVITAGGVIVLGRGLTSNAPNTAWIGTPGTNVLTVIIGQGDTVASPAARMIRFTNASGNDNEAGPVQLVAPRSTGGAVSPYLELAVGATPAGTAGTLQAIWAAIRASHTAVAGETGLMVMDVDTGVMQRMLVGAAGTGPGGVGRGLYLA